MSTKPDLSAFRPTEAQNRLLDANVVNMYTYYEAKHGSKNSLTRQVGLSLIASKQRQRERDAAERQRHDSEGLKRSQSTSPPYIKRTGRTSTMPRNIKGVSQVLSDPGADISSDDDEMPPNGLGVLHREPPPSPITRIGDPDQFLEEARSIYTSIRSALGTPESSVQLPEGFKPKTQTDRSLPDGASEVSNAASSNSMRSRGSNTRKGTSSPQSMTDSHYSTAEIKSTPTVQVDATHTDTPHDGIRRQTKDQNMALNLDTNFLTSDSPKRDSYVTGLWPFNRGPKPLNSRLQEVPLSRGSKPPSPPLTPASSLVPPRDGQTTEMEDSTMAESTADSTVDDTNIQSASSVTSDTSYVYLDEIVRVTSPTRSDRTFGLKSAIYPPSTINYRENGEITISKIEPGPIDFEQLREIEDDEEEEDGRRRLPGEIVEENSADALRAHFMNELNDEDFDFRDLVRIAQQDDDDEDFASFDWRQPVSHMKNSIYASKQSMKRLDPHGSLLQGRRVSAEPVYKTIDGVFVPQPTSRGVRQHISGHDAVLAAVSGRVYNSKYTNCLNTGHALPADRTLYATILSPVPSEDSSSVRSDETTSVGGRRIKKSPLKSNLSNQILLEEDDKTRRHSLNLTSEALQALTPIVSNSSIELWRTQHQTDEKISKFSWPTRRRVSSMSAIDPSVGRDATKLVLRPIGGVDIGGGRTEFQHTKSGRERRELSGVTVSRPFEILSEADKKLRKKLIKLGSSLDSQKGKGPGDTFYTERFRLKHQIVKILDKRKELFRKIEERCDEKQLYEGCMNFGLYLVETNIPEFMQEAKTYLTDPSKESHGLPAQTRTKANAALAKIAEAEGDSDEALKFWRETVALSPENPRYMANLAKVLNKITPGSSEARTLLFSSLEPDVNDGSDPQLLLDIHKELGLTYELCPENPNLRAAVLHYKQMQKTCQAIRNEQIHFSKTPYPLEPRPHEEQIQMIRDKARMDKQAQNMMLTEAWASDRIKTINAQIPSDDSLDFPDQDFFNIPAPRTPRPPVTGLPDSDTFIEDSFREAFGSNPEFLNSLLNAAQHHMSDQLAYSDYSPPKLKEDSERDSFYSPSISPETASEPFSSIHNLDIQLGTVHSKITPSPSNTIKPIPRSVVLEEFPRPREFKDIQIQVDLPLSSERKLQSSRKSRREVSEAGSYNSDASVEKDQTRKGSKSKHSRRHSSFVTVEKLLSEHGYLESDTETTNSYDTLNGYPSSEIFRHRSRDSRPRTQSTFNTRSTPDKKESIDPVLREIREMKESVENMPRELARLLGRMQTRSSKFERILIEREREREEEDRILRILERHYKQRPRR